VLEYQIGGAHSARAFAPGIAAGDRGVAVSVEVASTHSLGKLLLKPFLFVDHSQVVSVAATTSLQDAGMGVLIAIGPRVALTRYYARSFGHGGRAEGADRLYATITVRL
jgi:hemolysin activation/secretion protein